MLFSFRLINLSLLRLICFIGWVMVCEILTLWWISFRLFVLLSYIFSSFSDDDYDIGTSPLMSHILTFA